MALIARALELLRAAEPPLFSPLEDKVAFREKQKQLVHDLEEERKLQKASNQLPSSDTVPDLSGGKDSLPAPANP